MRSFHRTLIRREASKNARKAAKIVYATLCLMVRREELRLFAIRIASALLACALLIGYRPIPGVGAQERDAAPSLTATAKGPDQINLTWPPVRDSFYGFLVEIRSSGDSRYGSWTELAPLPQAAGYTCDPGVVLRGGRCNISDPSGRHVYNPPNNGVPYWVTDPTYIDPQDDTPAQFIAWGLKPGTSYSFRIRTYSGAAKLTYGAYSNDASATTEGYPARYVSTKGNDANDGTASDTNHAWRTLAHASAAISCGQVLIAGGGEYANDAVTMPQNCAAEKKAVVMAAPGETAAITSMPAANAWHPILLKGSHIVIDGLTVTAPMPANEYDVKIDGSYNAILNLDAHPQVVPALHCGLYIAGSHNLVYRSALHDFGSPDNSQNPGGNGGVVLTLEGDDANYNIIWSNHLTRGGRDVSLAKKGPADNRWLNNVLDGGWGMAIEVLGADHNLIEGNIVKSAGSLVTFLKPGMEISAAYTTVRRNLVIGGSSWAIEQSAQDASAANNLIYNNTFYAPKGCILQSRGGGPGQYDHDIFANNICHKFTATATDIWNVNGTNAIAHNLFLFAGGAGDADPNHPIIIWNHAAGAQFDSPRTLAHADASWRPPFFGNKGLDIDPAFVSEADFDLHLSARSPLNGAGMLVADKDWGTAEGAVDLGAFGIHLRGQNPSGSQKAPPTLAEVRARPAPKDEPNASPRAARASSTVPEVPASIASSPAGIAASALIAAASGDVAGARRRFTRENFPADKQEDAVREAYIEVELQRLLTLTAQGQCQNAGQLLTTIGAEDKSLPFTLHPFHDLMKGARFQYLLGEAEAVCVDDKAAKKRFERVAKMKADPASADFAYPYLAAVRIQSKVDVSNFLTSFPVWLQTAPPASRPALLYNHGMLLLLAGRKREAMDSFLLGQRAAPPGMLQYLNALALRNAERP